MKEREKKTHIVSEYCTIANIFITFNTKILSNNYSYSRMRACASLGIYTMFILKNINLVYLTQFIKTRIVNWQRFYATFRQNCKLRAVFEQY